MLTTAPTVMTASKLLLLAIALATTGISKLPGTQATCIDSPGSQATCGQHPITTDWPQAVLGIWKAARIYPSDGVSAGVGKNIMPYSCTVEGHHAAHPTCTSSRAVPCLSKPSSTPSKSGLVTSSLNRATTTPILSPLELRLPMCTFAWAARHCRLPLLLSVACGLACRRAGALHVPAEE